MARDVILGCKSASNTDCVSTLLWKETLSWHTGGGGSPTVQTDSGTLFPDASVLFLFIRSRKQRGRYGRLVREQQQKKKGGVCRRVSVMGCVLEWGRGLVGLADCEGAGRKVGGGWGGSPDYDLILEGSIKWFVYPSCGAGELEPGQLRVKVLFIIFPPVRTHERLLKTVAARRPRSKGPAGGVRQAHSKPLPLLGGLWSTKHVPHLHRPVQWKLRGPMETQRQSGY